jgi:RimJ/RimL family protein N-acetyltransferase
VIATDRLVLRQFEERDYEPYLAMLTDPAVAWRPPMSPEEVWHRLVRHVGHWAMFGYGNLAIVERNSGLFVGETGLWRARRDMGPDFDASDEAGWSLVTQWQRRGIAFEAAGAVHGWFDARFGPRRTVCMTDPANERSIRLARRLGYSPFRDGVYKDRPVLLFERMP